MRMIGKLVGIVLACGLLVWGQPGAAEQENPELTTLRMELQRNQRTLNDWPNLARYRDENAKLSAPALGENRVVFMGDSITDAWGRKYGKFFPDKPYVNRGIGGQTTPQMLIRFRPDVIALAPKVVVILAGTNDIAGNTGPSTLEAIEGNLASMAELAKANGIRVVLCSVMPVCDYITPQTKRRPPEKIKVLNVWIKDYAAKNQLVYLDYYSAILDDQEMFRKDLTYDGLHPNDVGYEVIQPLAEKAIAMALASGLQPQPAALSVEALKGGVYWVKGGSGANTGFVIGKKEVIVIDAKMTEESSKAVLAEIQKLTPNPVKYIVLTHSDGDHVNGLSAFPKGLTILAHANTRKDMEEAFKDPKMSSLQLYLPNQTFTGNRSLNIDGVRMNLLYFGPAHTSGDLVVFLPDQRIAFVGDLVFVGRDPLIHRQKGGSSFGLVQVLKKILALDADTFISGHNDPLKKTDIQGELTSIEEKQAKIKSLIQQGKSLDEIRAAFGVAAAPGQPAPRFPGLVDRIYQDLTGKE